MEINKPNSGQSVVLSFYDDADRLEELGMFVTNVDDSRWTLVYIDEKSIVSILEIDQEVLVEYSIKDKGVYTFRSRVIEVVENRIIVEEIAQPTRDQRRSFFRLNIKRPVTIFYDEEQIEAITKDISGGGMQLVSETEIPVDSFITLRFTLNKTLYQTKGKVQRSVKIDQEYVMAIRFIDIKENHQNEIITYLFNHQRMLIKRGNL